MEQSEQYQALEGRLEEAETRAETAEGRVASAEQDAATAREASQQVVEDYQAQQDALAQREADLVAREQAVGAAEAQVAANSVGEGIWTVGVDIEPGTYRTAEPVSANCYWAISTSGSNGSDLIDNDIPGGGHPTVTLREGQDFTNSRCGTFVKQ